MWLVRAVPREGHDGRNRSGRRFLVAQPTLLQDDEMTPEILADPLLVCEPVVPREIEIEVAVVDMDLSKLSLHALAAELERRGYWLFPVEVSPAEAEAFVCGVPASDGSDGAVPGPSPEREGESVPSDGADPSGKSGEIAAAGGRCTGTNKRGEQCKAQAAPGSERCKSHPEA